MPRDRTTTSYAVLGLLAIRPWTTYELAKQVQRSLRWFWPRADRKLYDEPKRLVAGGLATAGQEQQGKRPRTVYQITPEGRAALGDWLGEPPAPRTLEFEGMVKVFFADAGSRLQLLATVDRIEAQATERMEEIVGLAATRPLAFPEREHISAIGLQLFAAQEESTLRWARWAREQVEQWTDTADPGTWDAPAVLAEIAAPSPRGGSLGS